MKKIRISTGNNVFEAELFDTSTAKEILKNLPFSGNASVWGNEIYFSIPVNTDLENNARDILEIGELAFYPPLNAFCIFFGVTPISTDSRPRAAGNVNVFGKITSSLSSLHEIKSNDKIFIELAD